MREKAKQRNPVDIIINVMTLVGLFFNVDMINKYPEYRKVIVLWGSAWIVSGVLKVVWKKRLNDYIRRKKLKNYIYAIITILNAVAWVIIFTEWLKYSIYPPALKITESDMFCTVVYAYEEDEKVLYPKVYEIGENEENPTAYMEFIITNEINQSVSIESIQMNILNYKYEKFLCLN